jgi:hypothetical protein
MKIQILNNTNSVIEGYQHFVIKDETVDLSTLSDNECEYILANEVLDSVSLENIGNLVGSIVKKLRLGGTIVIGGTDIRLFSKSVVNNLLKEVEASNLLKDKLSMTTPDGVISLLSQLGLNVQTCILAGIHYEITATRN